MVMIAGECDPRVPADLARGRLRAKLDYYHQRNHEHLVRHHQEALSRLSYQSP